MYPVGENKVGLVDLADEQICRLSLSYRRARVDWNYTIYDTYLWDDYERDDMESTEMREMWRCQPSTWIEARWKRENIKGKYKCYMARKCVKHGMVSSSCAWQRTACSQVHQPRSTRR